MFKKGNPYGGKRIGSGRKKKPERIVREAIDNLRSDIPELIEQLRLKALKGDREAAIYLLDRALGKPKQQTDIDISGGQELGVAMVDRIHQLVEVRQRQLTEPIEKGDAI